MEAARIAAERGHQVTLYEEKNRLGGRLPALQTLKGSHERIMDHLEYLEHQLDKQKVTVVTGKKVDAAFIASEKPDTVVVAVGSTPDPLSDLISAGSVMNMNDLLEELEVTGSLDLTDDIGRGLGEQFASQILEKGAVDSVSGATVTSNAVSTALNDCLRQAGLMP